MSNPSFEGCTNTIRGGKENLIVDTRRKGGWAWRWSWEFASRGFQQSCTSPHSLLENLQHPQKRNEKFAHMKKIRNATAGSR
jgi:hypothetical protein